MESPFFRAFRERQNAVNAPRAYNDNMLTPCCVIDQPWVLREIVKEYGAYPTDGAGDLLNGHVAQALDEYSKRIHAIFDPIWEMDYTEFHQKNTTKNEHCLKNRFPHPVVSRSKENVAYIA